MTDPLLHHALAATVEARAMALWKQEKRDRRGPYRALHSPARHNRVTELRALLALRRSAKRLARGAPSDRVYHELGYHQAQSVPV